MNKQPLGLLMVGAQLLCATIATAAGVNLSWNDCGTFGVYRQTFACDTNAGSHTLVGSYVVPDLPEPILGNSFVVDLMSPCPAFPDWWQLRTGLCRQTSLAGNFDFTAGPFDCLDYWQGGALGGVVMDPPSPSSASIKGVCSLPAGDSRIVLIPGDTEVYSFKLIINHAKTVGPGACQGCFADLCIVLRSIQLGLVSGNSVILTQPAVRNDVSWQSGALVYPDFVPLPPFCSGNCPTPARDRTWGSIKALYR